jgi:uncharacterized protein YidB (DUF937 family)
MGILSIFRIVRKLFGGRLGKVLGGLGGKELSAVATALLGKGGANFSSLVSNFESAGLGNMIQSWISRGANPAVSSEQVKSAVGSDVISGIAGDLGVSEEEAATKAAGVLPELIDKLTPDGSVPDEKTLAKKLAALLK